jgi:26S proteasome regulatory subunit N6
LTKVVEGARNNAGILDQGTGCLEIFEELPENRVYSSAMDVIHNMGKVVDALFDRSRKLIA